MGAILDIAAGAANIAGNQMQSAQEFGRTKQLMGIQQQNQMKLNEQGQKLQMSTWEQTNYPAQVEMLKKAGLNPGLLYSKGGTGGTTGSQGGGSAASGSAPRTQPIDISNMLSMKMLEKQIELVEAQKQKTEAETGVIGATGVKEAESRIGKLIAETANESLKGELIKVQTLQEKIRTSRTDEQIMANLANLAAQTRKINLESQLSEGTMDAIIQETQQKAIGAYLENTLTAAKTQLTSAEIASVTQGIAQKWTELEQRTRGLDQKDKEIQIQGFKTEMEAEYPNVMNVIGKGGKTFVKMLENIGAALRGNNPIPVRDEININGK